MKAKIISMFTITALLVTTISSAAFAQYGGNAGNNTNLLASQKHSNDKNDKDDDERESVSGSVYKEDKGNKNKKTEELSVYKVTKILIAYAATKTPEEVINMLMNEQQVPLYNIVKAFNYLPGIKNRDNSILTDAQIKAYAEVINKLVENEKDNLQERIDALQELSDLYDKVGELEKALNIQKKAIKEDYKNILNYKKIGQVFNKKGDKDIKVFTVGEEVYFDVKPIIKDDRTLVPIRAIAESLKANVQWDEATKTVTLTKNGVVIKLVMGSAIAVIDGKEVKLDVPAELINNRIVVPVRFISEAFKSTVEWEPENQIVIIY